jgi:radical SAM superfamily enzyme YgiQ (UPF0313 family)
MNILLLMPPEPFFSPFSTAEKRIPIGIAYLMEVLARRGHHVEFVDCYLDPEALWRSDLWRRPNFDLVGIQANTICLDGVIRLATFWQRLRESGRWKGKLVLGGPATATHLDSFPAWIDHVVVGEGENAILKLADGTSERVLREPWNRSLDDLPLPGFEPFLKLPYDWSSHWLPGRRLVNLNTSRGCPFECTFCSVSSVWGRQYRAMSAERTVEWMQQVKALGFQAVYFREDNFTLRRDRTVTFCEQVLGRDLRMEWICETRADTLDESVITLMARAGCRAVYIGVESGSDRVLRLLKKGETKGQFRQAFASLRRHGIFTYASFVVGLPGASPADDDATRKFSDELRPDVKGFNVFVGIPHSELYRQALPQAMFTDYRGLVFLKGHNGRVRDFYGPLSLPRMGVHALSRLDSRCKKSLGWSVPAHHVVEPLARASARFDQALRRARAAWRG